MALLHVHVTLSKRIQSRASLRALPPPRGYKSVSFSTPHSQSVILHETPTNITVIL